MSLCFDVVGRHANGMMREVELCSKTVARIYFSGGGAGVTEDALGSVIWSCCFTSVNRFLFPLPVLSNSRGGVGSTVDFLRTSHSDTETPARARHRLKTPQERSRKRNSETRLAEKEDGG